VLLELQACCARSGSLTSLLADEAQREVPPIRPRIAVLDGQRYSLLPWDPEYAPEAAERAWPERFRTLPSRFALSGGPQLMVRPVPPPA
jgi:hypothetical protein